jgi:hypothetical protein
MRFPRARLVLVPLLACAAPLALATTAYKCTDARGAVSFQDQPCRAGTRQQTIALPDAAPATPAPTVDATPPDSAPAPAPVVDTPPAPPPIPPPAFYLCTRYDGSRYVSDTGQGGSALVPLGVLGTPNRSLADAYGGRNGVGVSAPGLRKIPHIPAASVPFGGMDVWIDDECHFAAPREACAYLRSALGDVDDKLRRAFSDTEAELKRQRADIEQKMRGC